MSDHSLDRQGEFRRELRGYATGFVAALVLTLIPFALVAWHLLPAGWVLAVVFILAGIQLVVHVRYFLHIGFDSHRDDLFLLLFTTVIVLLLAIGTLFILVSWHGRMI